LRDLETQHAVIKRQSAIEVGHLQMHMADTDSGVDG